ncbi:MAG: hypothetical protein ACOX52_06700 [Verrucomicrobiota bacterium]
MKMVRVVVTVMMLGICGVLVAEEADWQPLFSEDGVPQGWRVTSWADLAEPGPERRRSGGWRMGSCTGASRAARG